VRIAIVGPTHPYKGGIAHHTTELANRLSAVGHDVDLISWSAQYPAVLYPGQQRLKGAEGEPYPRTTYPLAWYRPDGWWRTGRRLAKESYDAVVLIVVTPVQAPASLGLLAGMRARRMGERPRVLALCHNVLPHELRAGDRRLSKAVLDRVDAVLVHSPAQAEVASTLTSRTVHVTELAPHFPRKPEDPDVPRDPQRRLLFFGIVRPYKGLDVLLRAMADVPGVSLTVAGEFWGGDTETCKLVKELGLVDRVTLQPGYVPADELSTLFASADAVVLPYRSGTATQNVWLAHAHGLPVVATDVGTMARHIRHDGDGLVVPPEDVSALARALRSLYHDDTLARLRAGVRPPDSDQLWNDYVDVVVSALGGAPCPPRHETARG